MKTYKEFVNSNLIKEGADWIFLRSANVCVDSYSLGFMPLGENGLPDLEIPEIEPDDPEYDEILNKLNDRDRKTYDAVKKENEW